MWDIPLAKFTTTYFTVSQSLPLKTKIGLKQRTHSYLILETIRGPSSVSDISVHGQIVPTASLS
jgi:hypothetical protein